MSTPPPVPERLRRSIEDDLHPVRPLRSPLVRTLAVAAWAVVLLVAAPVALGLRPDASSLGPLLTWGAAGLEALGGLLLVWLALREAIPGSGVALPEGIAAVAAAAAIEAGVAVLTFARSAPAAGAGDALAHGVECFSMETSLGLPALALTAWLTVRAFPVRPAWAGLLGGAGAGMLANGVQHLVCGIPSLEHVMVWHMGASAALAAAGWGAGRLWERYRGRAG